MTHPQTLLTSASQLNSSGLVRFVKKRTNLCSKKQGHAGVTNDNAAVPIVNYRS